MFFRNNICFRSGSICPREEVSALLVLFAVLHSQDHGDLKVAYSGKRVIISRNGKDTAAAVSLEYLQALRALDEKFDLEAFLTAKDEDMVDWDDLKGELNL